MKNSKNILFIINFIYIVITGAINVFGYFNLPDRIATQFGFAGEKVNTMPKSI